MNHLEKAVLDIIERLYCAKYIGGLEVKKLISGGYKLSLFLGNRDKGGLVICADIQDESEFLKFIEKELDERLLIRVEYFEGIRIYNDEERRINCKN